MKQIRTLRWSLAYAVCAALLVLSCKRDAPVPAAGGRAAGAPPSASAAPRSANATSAGSVTAAGASAIPARPLYYERPITDADLSDRTLRELAILRNYIFARAGQEFRKDWLRDFFSQYDWYHPQKKPAEVDQFGRDNAEKIANYDAAIGSAELRRRADAVLARQRGHDAGANDTNDTIELRLLSERLGEWLAPKGSKVRPSPLENPEMLDQVLSLDDLGNLSRRDLRILRNTVYARKGRDFVSEGLREYFGAKSWYKLDPDYADQRLSAVDWKNIKLVASVEDSLGGPISDGEHFGRTYGWFGGA